MSYKEIEAFSPQQTFCLLLGGAKVASQGFVCSESALSYRLAVSVSLTGVSEDIVAQAFPVSM